MNEDLYDTGSAVVGLYRLFTNFFKFELLVDESWSGQTQASLTACNGLHMCAYACANQQALDVATI